MNEKNTGNELNKVLFSQLVMMLSSSVMQQLGKLVNPVTHKSEVDLEGAQMTIDMLLMLQEKTKGNLDDDEGKMLGALLSSLQLNYVETMQSAPAPAADKKTGTEKTADKPDEPPKKTGDNTPGEKKEPHYHKSYE